VADTEEERERHEHQNQERKDEMRRVTFQKLDKSKWPTNVRPIGLAELDRFGIDPDGILYWNGKPVEIARRLDLTG
jgi:hypothetical protein